MEIEVLSERLDAISRRYAERLNFERDGDWFLLKLHEEVGELTQAYLQLTGRARHKGSTQEAIQETFAQEIADVICQLLLLAKQHNIDVVRQIESKWLVHECPNRA